MQANSCSSILAHISRVSGVVAMLAVLPSAPAAFADTPPLSPESRLLVRAQYTMRTCIDSPDVLTCMTSKGYRCKSVRAAKTLVLNCEYQHDLGQVEVMISCADRDWTIKLMSVAEGSSD